MIDYDEGDESVAHDSGGGTSDQGGLTKKSPSQREIQAWLISVLSKRLNIKPESIDTRKPFSHYGLSSKDAVVLSGEVGERLGRNLSPTLLYEYPNIEAIAKYLSRDVDSTESSSHVVDNPEASTEPVAIIGIGCRFPGASGPEGFWNLLRNGKDLITEVPMNRWDFRAYNEPLSRSPGTMVSRWGGFLDQVNEFDAGFFGISPREATRMDPQQRLLLEVAWEALEDAGQVAEQINGTSTGVFVGISSNDYYQLQSSASGGDDPYVGTGNALSIAANRLSYCFGFRGPSMSVDTACSSSLVAVHLACQSLRSGESTLALAGGVNVILSPAITISFTKAGFLSPEGRCKSFDARADGYVRGEGAGMIVLKLLSQALADADPIYAVISGSAVNQDGRTNGLTAPSRQAQEDVLREAYKRAAISPGQIQYVEAHGTGTALGDPIEARALGAVLGAGRTPGNRCAIGSVKTNIGHLEAAAGIAGLIKTALSLKHQLIPPSLHFKEPSPHIPFETLPLYVQQSLEPWPRSSGRARAGVSSFGFGGTNAHVVLEEALALNAAQAQGGNLRRDRARLLPLSARSDEALQSVCRLYRDFLAGNEDDSDLALQDICYTTSVRRTHHDYRLALVGHSREEFVAQLDGFLRVAPHPNIARSSRTARSEDKLAFVFSGQGTQWFGMSRELLDQEPVFLETIERCDEHLREFADWHLLEELTSDEARSRLDQTEIAQPAICAIEIALATLWRSWGIFPDAVVGHSLGEIAAAHVAGVFSLREAMEIVFHRSRLMQRATGQGKMVALGLSVEDCENALKGFEGRLNLAAINSQRSTVISGDPDAIEEILESLRERDVFYRVLNVGYAFHSYQMEPFQSELAEALHELRPQVASIPIFSTVTGHIGDGENLDALYWSRSISEPVRFASAINGLIDRGFNTFLEISPKQVLLPMISQCAERSGKQVTVFASIRQERGEVASMLDTLGTLYTLGFQVAWNKVSGTVGRCVALPAYPWQRERHWLEIEDQNLDQASDFHCNPRALSDMQKRPLLGRKLRDIAHFPGSHTWETEINQQSFPYLEEHSIQCARVLPITAYIEMVLEASKESYGTSACAVTQMEFPNILLLPEDGSRLVQIVLSPAGVGESTFHIYGRQVGEESRDDWLLHATGRISREDKLPAKVHVNNKTNRPIDFAVMFFAGSENTDRADKYHLVIEASKFADRHGFSSVWVPERHFTDFGSLYPNPAVLHAALARETRTIRLRAGSVVVPLHDPIRIAEEWAMVDNLSGGRIELSFASGWHPNDFVFFPERYADRHEEMFRGISLLQKLWRGEAIQARSGNGEPFELRTYPRPLQSSIPIWITAAGNPQTFAKAGELGANLLTHLLDQDFETLEKQIALYRESRARHGHDSQTGRVSVMLHTFVGENIDVVREQVREPYKAYLKSIYHLLKGLAYSRGRDVDLSTLSEEERDEFANLLFERFFSKRALLGTPSSCFDLIERLKLIGVDEVSCLLDFGLDNDLSLKGLPYLNQLREMCSPQKDAGVFVQPERLPEEILTRLHEEINVSEWRERWRAQGVEDGPAFHPIKRLWRGDGEALGYLQPSDFDGLDGDSFHIHPTLLAACLQVLWATLPANSDLKNDGSLYLPTGLRKFVLHSQPVPGRSLWSHAIRQSDTNRAFDILEGDIRIIDDAGLLVAEALGIQFQRQREPVAPDADEGFGNLLYELQWQLKDPSGFDYPEMDEKESWIIFLDRGGVGERLATLLESRGQTCFRIRTGTTYAATGHQYTANPGNRQDINQLMESILAQEAPPLRGVLHLWSLDTIYSQDISISSLDDAQTIAISSALHLIQSLAKSGSSKQPRLWLVTRGAQALNYGSATLALAQAPLWGLGRTCAIEHPEFWGGLVDLDPQASEHDNASQLLEGICRRDREDQIAFRQQQPYVARLVRKGGLARRKFTLNPDASYLITGGLDGLGFEVARWMAERGAKHLILLGRTKLPPRERWADIEGGRLARHVARIGELEQLNVRVQYTAVDVADEEQMRSFLDSFRRENHPPILGIMHAASVWEDKGQQSLVRTLARLDHAALQAVFRAKVTGSWLLHKLFANADLDFFILFSSAASLLGSPGQGNYAAAGAFLDALAHHLRAFGRKVFSISWGPVSGTGFGASSEGLKVHEHWEARGVQRITPDQVLEAMDRVLSQDISHIAVAKMDWKLLLKSYTEMAGLPWATHMIAEANLKSPNQTSGQNENHLRQRLFAAAPNERQHLLESHLGKQVAMALRLTTSRLDVHQPITNLGFDSLMAIELRNRIQADLGVVLPIVHLLEGPSVAQIATALLDLLPAVDSTVAAPVPRLDSREEDIPADLEQLSATLDQLSDERVEALLRDMLASESSDQ